MEQKPNKNISSPKAKSKPARRKNPKTNTARESRQESDAKQAEQTPVTQNVEQYVRERLNAQTADTPNEKVS